MTDLTGRHRDDLNHKALRERSNFSYSPLSSQGPQDYRPYMLPPLSCPRLVDRPRELRHFLWVLLSFILLTATIALLIWIAGWVESEFEMTSVTSTRELRPVPRQLVQMVRDPASLSVIYHGGARGEERDSEPVELLVLVDSTASGHEMRRAARETWMTHPLVGVGVAVVFTVAGRGLEADSLHLLEAEAEQYRDIAIFPDSPQLPESEHLLYLLGWAQASFSHHHLLLRTKDRYYVRLEELLSDIYLRPPSSPLYWGYFEGNRMAHQEWPGKHPEPSWFLCNKFIRFAHSGGYVISSLLSRRLVKAADYLHLYQNEDVAMATWLSPFGDVEWRHDVRFDTDPGQSHGCQNSFLIFPTNNHGDMIQRHRRLAESGRVCRKEHFIVHPHSYDFSVLPSQCCHEL